MTEIDASHLDILSGTPNMPAVSIIMNVRDGAATVREAIDSTFAQTFLDWELIVWDDCSNDATPAIIAEYEDARVKYFRSEALVPLGQARQQAINRAKGEWIAFLDQDDVWLPRKLELQMGLADSPTVGLVYGRTLVFDRMGKQRDYDYFHEFVPLPEGTIVAELLGRGCFIAMSSVLLRRSTMAESGPIPEYIRITPDYFMYPAICSKYEARAVQSVVCRVRLHSASMTNIYRREALEETMEITERWRDALPSKEFAQRRARISTALAFEEMRRPASFIRGVRRLSQDGSPAWLAGRPFAHFWRTVRRKVRKPWWKKFPEPDDLNNPHWTARS